MEQFRFLGVSWGRPVDAILIMAQPQVFALVDPLLQKQGIDPETVSQQAEAATQYLLHTAFDVSREANILGNTSDDPENFREDVSSETDLHRSFIEKKPQEQGRGYVPEYPP